MISKTLDKKLVRAEKPVDANGCWDSNLANLTGEVRGQVAEIYPIPMMAVGARPLVALKQNLPTSHPNQ